MLHGRWLAPALDVWFVYKGRVFIQLQVRRLKSCKLMKWWENKTAQSLSLQSIHFLLVDRQEVWPITMSMHHGRT